MGDLCVGDDGGILEHVAELAKAATEDYGGLDILWQA